MLLLLWLRLWNTRSSLQPDTFLNSTCATLRSGALTCHEFGNNDGFVNCCCNKNNFECWEFHRKLSRFQFPVQWVGNRLFKRSVWENRMQLTAELQVKQSLTLKPPSSVYSSFFRLAGLAVWSLLQHFIGPISASFSSPSTWIYINLKKFTTRYLNITTLSRPTTTSLKF